MAKTVVEAFNKFMADTVNLDPDRTKKAREVEIGLLDKLELFLMTTLSFQTSIQRRIFSMVRFREGQRKDH